MNHIVSTSETSTRSVKRAADLLRALSRLSGCRNLTELARETALSKATAYRILQTLAAEEFVEFQPETGLYRIGGGLIRITLEARASSRLAATQTFQRLSEPAMCALRDETGETVVLVLREGDRRTNIAVTLGSHELIAVPKVGAQHALHLGGPGKLLLAFLPPAERKAYLRRASGAVRISNGDLERTLADGFATSEGEAVEGQCSIAAPIHKDGAFVAVLNLIIPSVRFLEKRKAAFIPLVKTTSEDIGRAIEGAWDNDVFNWE